MSYNNSNDNGKAGVEYTSTSLHGVNRSRQSRINQPSGVPDSITIESSVATMNGGFRCMSSHIPPLPYSLRGIPPSPSPKSPSDPKYLLSILESVIDIVNEDLFENGDREEDDDDESFANCRDTK